MELRTYTSLWRVERRLHRLGDINLPFAISYRQLGVLFAFSIPWVGLMLLLRVPLGNSYGFAAWVMPIIAVTYFANKPLIESKTGIELAWSNIKYISQSKMYADLRSYAGTRLIAVRGLVWRDASR